MADPQPTPPAAPGPASCSKGDAIPFARPLTTAARDAGAPGAPFERGAEARDAPAGSGTGRGEPASGRARGRSQGRPATPGPRTSPSTREPPVPLLPGRPSLPRPAGDGPAGRPALRARAATGQGRPRVRGPGARWARAPPRSTSVARGARTGRQGPGARTRAHPGPGERDQPSRDARRPSARVKEGRRAVGRRAPSDTPKYKERRSRATGGPTGPWSGAEEGAAGQSFCLHPLSSRKKGARGPARGVRVTG